MLQLIVTQAIKVCVTYGLIIDCALLILQMYSEPCSISGIHSCEGFWNSGKMKFDQVREFGWLHSENSRLQANLNVEANSKSAPPPAVVYLGTGGCPTGSTLWKTFGIHHSHLARQANPGSKMQSPTLRRRISAMPLALGHGIHGNRSARHIPSGTLRRR